MIHKFFPQMNALKCREHFERTFVRPVGRSAGLREVNKRKWKIFLVVKTINFYVVILSEAEGS